MKKPILSVIIPVYNFHKYFYRCLESIKNQTLKNIEIIIIDDYSSNCMESMLEIYLKDKRFKYVRLNENVGPGGARNVGINMAKGYFIGFCDSDDWLDQDFYRKTVKSLINCRADIALCGHIREYNSSKKNSIHKCKYNSQILMSGTMAFQIMSCNTNTNIKISPFCTSKVYRKTFLKKINIKFQEKVFFQDIIFIVKVLLEAPTVVCIPDVFYHYTKRQDSIIQSFSKKHIEDFINLCMSIREYLNDKKLFKKYCDNYYKIVFDYFDVILKEICEFVPIEKEKKNYIFKTISALKRVVDINEYKSCISSKEIIKRITYSNDDSIVF